MSFSIILLFNYLMLNMYVTKNESGSGIPCLLGLKVVIRWERLRPYILVLF